MAREIDDCTPLVGECVRVLFRNFCIGEGGITDDPTTWPTLSGSVKLGNIPAGTRLCDPNGAEFLQVSNTGIVGTIQNFAHSSDSNDPASSSWEICEVDGCEYLSVQTCALPANRDSDFDPDDPASIIRSLEPQGSVYLFNISVAGIQMPEIAFEIDAAIDYSAEYVCDCILLKNLAADGTPPVDLSEVFSDRVCNTDCIKELRADMAAADAAIIQQIIDADAAQQVLIDANTACCDDHEIRIAALEADEHTTLDSFGAVDNGDGTTTITVTLSDGSTGSAIVSTPTEVFVASTTFGAPVDNGDGTSTITLTTTLSDGTVYTAPFTIPNPTVDTNTDTWITPTSISIDCVAGELVFSYTDQDGNPQTLTQSGLTIPCTDTNTTNATFEFDPATGELTITDSDGNALDVTIPPDVDVLTASCETEAGDLIEIIDGATDDEDEVRFRIDPDGPVLITCDGPINGKGPGCNGFRKGPNGGAAVHYEDFTEIGGAAEGPITAATPDATTPIGVWEDISSIVAVDITNPSPCDNMKFMSVFTMGGVVYRMGAGNSWLVQLQYDNGGGTFIGATNSWIGNFTGSVMSSPDVIKMANTTITQVGTVLPCSTTTLRSKIRRLTQAYAPDATNLLSLNDGSSHFIRVLGTTGN